MEEDVTVNTMFSGYDNVLKPIVAFMTMATFSYGLWKWFWDSYSARVRRAALALSRKKDLVGRRASRGRVGRTALGLWGKKGLVGRDGSQELKSEEEYELPRTAIVQELERCLKGKYRSIVVYGNRGVGKSTAIAQFVRKHKKHSVLHWNIDAVQSKSDVFSILQSEMQGFLPENCKADRFVYDVLESMDPQLTIVISVDGGFQANTLESILLFCKEWGPDNKLIRFVVDMSSCWSATNMKIRLRDLRALGIHVPSLLVEEARLLVKEHLPEGWTPILKTEVGQLITDKNEVDLTPLTLTNFCNKMDVGMNYAKAKKAVEEEVEQLRKEARTVLVSFHSNLKKKFKEMYPVLELPELVKDLKFEDGQLTMLEEQLSSTVLVQLVQESGVPHVFSIDPFSLQFSLNGKIMKQEFIAYFSKKNG